MPYRRSTEVSGYEAMTAHDHGAVVDATDQPLPRGLGHLRRNWQCQPSLARLLDDRLGNRVLGCLFERRRQPQHVVLYHAAICAGRHDLRPPIRQRPRLVEDQRARAGHRFKGAGTLDQHSVMSGAGKASHQRHGHSQDQRARRCHHQYGNSADGVPRYPPRPRRRLRQGRAGKRATTCPRAATWVPSKPGPVRRDERCRHRYCRLPVGSQGGRMPRQHWWNRSLHHRPPPP
jgi:hypothetical protein